MQGEKQAACPRFLRRHLSVERLTLPPGPRKLHNNKRDRAERGFIDGKAAAMPQLSSFYRRRQAAAGPL